MAGPADLIVYKGSLAAIQHGYVGLLDSICKTYPKEFETLVKYRNIRDWVIRYGSLGIYQWAVRNSIVKSHSYDLFDMATKGNRTVIQLINANTNQNILHRICMTTRNNPDSADIFVAAMSHTTYRNFIRETYHWSLEYTVERNKTARTNLSKAIEEYRFNSKDGNQYVDFLKEQVSTSTTLPRKNWYEYLERRDVFSFSEKKVHRKIRDFYAFDILWSRQPQLLDLDFVKKQNIVTFIEKCSTPMIKKYYIYCKDVTQYPLYEHLSDPYILASLLDRIFNFKFGIKLCRILKHVYNIDKRTLIPLRGFRFNPPVLTEKLVKRIVWFYHNFKTFVNSEFWDRVSYLIERFTDTIEVQRLIDLVEYNRGYENSL